MWKERQRIGGREPKKPTDDEGFDNQLELVPKSGNMVRTQRFSLSSERKKTREEGLELIRSGRVRSSFTPTYVHPGW